MIKVYSDKAWAKKKRIEKLPQYVVDVVIAKLKKDAIGFMKEYKKGILNNDLGLEPLKDETIRRKVKQGFKKPEAPLYGIGDDDKDSYMNALKVKKLKDGWKVYVSKRMHWSKRIKLDYLFAIHEYGCTIERSDGVLIRIPPRPVFLLTYQRWMAKRRDYPAEVSKEVKRAMNEYIMMSKTGYFNKINMETNKKDAEFEE